MRSAIGSELLIATHNRGKVEEFRALLASRGIRVRSNEDFGLPAPVETETTFRGNARLKARAAMLATGLPALADDSGIEVADLDGAPGVRTADWAEGPDGRDFERAMHRVWTALMEAKAAEPWLARFRCVLVLAAVDGREETFSGSIEGRLVWPTRGATGHGYDPMFVARNQTRTFGEMSFEEKNRISHRSEAVERFMAWLDRTD